METKQQCSFFLLRYVPDAVKNEFINFGLVLMPLAAPAEIRFSKDWSRVRALDPQADLELLEAMENELRDKLQNTSSDRDVVLKRIEDSFSNALQVSEIKACLADSPAQEADFLAQLYLESPRRQPAREASARQRLFRRMRTEFERTGMWQAMKTNIVVSEYTRSGDPLKIDCGYSAKSMVKMFHATALKNDVNTAKVLAFTYPRLAEGIMRAEGRQAELTAVVEDDLNLTDEGIRFAFEILEQQAIHIVPIKDMPDVAAQVAKDFGIF
ncbi:MAG TPA: DUF3037 domain-containing protein [Candidatus Angelobacter sp.]|jgi:hypothetical protein|nr:DUF3037 domain-containing protein [Candidatus Angelobacter sp.]